MNLILSVAHVYDIVFFTRLLSMLPQRYIKRSIMLIKTTPYLQTRLERITQHISCLNTSILICDKEYIYDYRPSQFVGRSRHPIRSYLSWLRSNVSPENILISNDKSALMSNIELNYFNHAILVQQKADLVFDESLYKFLPLKSLVFSLTAILAGGCPVVFSQLEGTQKRQLRIQLVYKRQPKIILHSSHIYSTLPFIDLGSLPIPESTQKGRPVIFGSAFFSWGLKSYQLERLVLFYLSCTKALRCERYIYIPHPLEKTAEYSYLVDNLQVQLEYIEVDQFLSAEDYCLNNYPLCTISIGSTASKSAFQMGIASIVGYRYIFQDQALETAYDEIFDDVDQAIHFSNFECSERPLFAITPPRGPSIKTFLRLIDSFGFQE